MMLVDEFFVGGCIFVVLNQRYVASGFAFSSRFCPEKKLLLLVDFWSFASTSTKIQPTFFKKKEQQLQISSFRVSVFFFG